MAPLERDQEEGSCSNSGREGGRNVASTNARKCLARPHPTTRRARPFALPRSRGGSARRRPYRMRRPSFAREGVCGNRTAPGLRCGAPRGVTRPWLPRGRVARRGDHDPPLRSEHRSPLLDRRVRPASRIRRGLRGHGRTARFAGRRPRERRRVVPLSPPLARAAPTRIASRGWFFEPPEAGRAVDVCGLLRAIVGAIVGAVAVLSPPDCKRPRWSPDSRSHRQARKEKRRPRFIGRRSERAQ